MADHMGAAIWIGGDVTRRTAKKLCSIICEQGVSLEWSERLFEPRQPEELVDACQQEQEGPLLFLCDIEASWGEFQVLEAFLVQHRISFMRQTDGYDSAGPELVEYRPALGLVRFLTDSGGEPLVLLEVARSAELALQQLLSQKKAAFPRHSLRRVWHELRRQLPPDVPRLTAFRLV